LEEAPWRYLTLQFLRGFEIAMCGRFALYSDSLTLAHRFSTEAPAGLHPRFNVAPGQPILTVREESDKRRFAWVRWGLVPHWAKEINTGYSTINARAETVASKPAFRDAFKRRRCLIPANGFYEWQEKPGSKGKQPWFVALRNRLPMALAGLWERWRSPEGDEVESCAIIVTAANELMEPVHDRMPVILASSHWNTWLAPSTRDFKLLQNLLKPYPNEEIAVWKVSTKVNNPQNDSDECIEAQEA
jgi:putative SOS response-associated peptidase YedK